MTPSRLLSQTLIVSTICLDACDDLYKHSDVDVFFTGLDFTAGEPELKIPVSVGKSRRIASPLVLKVTPLELPSVGSVLGVDTSSQASCLDQQYSCECRFSAAGVFSKSMMSSSSIHSPRTAPFTSWFWCYWFSFPN